MRYLSTFYLAASVVTQALTSCATDKYPDVGASTVTVTCTLTESYTVSVNLCNNTATATTEAPKKGSNTTTTEAPNTTTTEAPNATPALFILQPVDSDPETWVTFQLDSDGFNYAQVTTSIKEATQFVLDPDGFLTSDGDNVFGYDIDGDSTSTFLILLPLEESKADFFPLQCSLNAALEIQCKANLFVQFGIDEPDLKMGVAEFDFTEIGGVGPVKIKAIPV